MQEKMFVAPENFNIAVNDFDAKKSARYSQVLAVSGLSIMDARP